ncbi:MULTISPECIES: restriction endonuclease subunit S [Pseudomonas]|uniref:Type I site-specific deoxyribonuclease n=4 Tax=Pseudomonas syringae group genomosp. 2 TaxID=251698 RepID=A0AAX1VL41_PSEAJ|nr:MULTISPECIES: restriction endonuclease subunit S [Pseudomonas]KPX54803.1 Type I site-specific deoxyribonuclease [Pseudomonas amygdali pv. lachrymans]KPY79964.1 Type I site-specific deoxyribonuclease [Pseudomonas amygdali pv. tabaci]PBQ11388.1 restriction endonuclease subunit S [Pseudomonas congelans]RML75135.1 Type I site-specific deoxyribonuclease [Pseudomonas amygdali pv. tabaci]RMR81150.1 Type I site-specific deoxyribonuclease [Pseudomonas amygdali pv. tabaci]
MSSKTKKTGVIEDSKPVLIPRLRFPEFRKMAGWKKTQLQKIARPVSDRAVTGDDDNVLSLSGEHGLVLQRDFFGKKIAGDSTERYLKLLRNDFVYNDRTTKASIFGTIKRLSKYSGGIVSPIYKCFRFLSDENPVFWEWYFESGSHDAQLGSLVNEGARAGRFNISISQFLSTSAWRPDKLEQQKVAECLSSVDELIAAQARKVSELKIYKKGLMQRLFTREGETQPRLRFPEFQNAGEWKVKRLSGMIDLISGMHLSPDDYSTVGEVPYFTGPSDFTNDLSNVTKWTKRTANVSQLKDTLITVKGSGVGEIWYSTLPEVAMGRQLMAVRSKNGSSRFMFQFLLTKKSRFEDLGSGNMIPGLSRAVILELEACFPNLSEQERIADCLTSLDDLIAAQTLKHDALKTYKKGLMQQLFPATAEVEA